jgi:hypothetical protein
VPRFHPKITSQNIVPEKMKRIKSFMSARGADSMNLFRKGLIIPKNKSTTNDIFWHCYRKIKGESEDEGR